MAFCSKAGNLLGRVASNWISQEISSTKPFIFQAIRCMSTSKLFIRGLSPGTDDATLKDAFSKYGQVSEARVIADRRSGKSKGFGHITYSSADEATAAVEALHNQAAEKGVQTKDCLHDAFEYMHRTKDGSYTDAKSERIAKERKELAEEMAQPLPGTTEPRRNVLLEAMRGLDRKGTTEQRRNAMHEHYLEAMRGLDRKGRLFGGGSLAKSLRSNDLDSAATSSQIDRQEIDNRLEEMEQRLEREQEERKQLYEQVQAQQKLIQELISKSSQSAPSSS